MSTQTGEVHLALAPGELVAAVMDGGVSIKAVYSRLNREKAQEEETA